MRKILISLMLLVPVLMLGSCDILDRTDNVRFTELKPLTKAVGYLVLTNDPGITFQEVLTSMYSSSSTTWIRAERALLIGFIY